MSVGPLLSRALQNSQSYQQDNIGFGQDYTTTGYNLKKDIMDDVTRMKHNEQKVAGLASLVNLVPVVGPLVSSVGLAATSGLRKKGYKFGLGTYEDTESQMLTGSLSNLLSDAVSVYGLKRLGMDTGISWLDKILGLDPLKNLMENVDRTSYPSIDADKYWSERG